MVDPQRNILLVCPFFPSFLFSESQSWFSGSKEKNKRNDGRRKEEMERMEREEKG